MSNALPEGYCDLNLPYETDIGDGPKTLRDRILQAISLGYQTLAVDVKINQDDLTTKTAKKFKHKKAKLDETAKELMLDFPAPPEILLKEDDYPELAAQGKKPRLLSRLTITFHDNNFLPIFNKSDTASKYDLLALCPSSASALQSILKAGFRADIIVFDPERVKDVRWSRKLYFECVEKHMFFELCYSPCIRDADTRRRIISQGHNYHAVGKARNIILTSAAQRPIELRGPHDVANLGFLFGLNEHQGKMAVKTFPLNAVNAALGRKLGPFRARVEKLSELKDGDEWKVPGKNEDEEESSEEMS